MIYLHLCFLEIYTALQMYLSPISRLFTMNVYLKSSISYLWKHMQIRHYCNKTPFYHSGRGRHTCSTCNSYCFSNSGILHAYVNDHWVKLANSNCFYSERYAISTGNNFWLLSFIFFEKKLRCPCFSIREQKAIQTYCNSLLFKNINGNSWC